MNKSMTQSDIDDINTTSRDEMVCPHCWTKGLEKSKSYASQFDGDGKKEIVYASACSNPNCPNHDGGRADPGRVPPKSVKNQYSSIPFVSTVTEALSGNLKIASIAIAVAVVGLLLFSGGIPLGGDSGSEGTAQASNIEYENISEQSDGFSAVKTEGEWTIYKANGTESYLVAGQLGGNITYLNSEGEPISQPHTFSSLDDAESAIFAWRTKHNQSPEEYPEPTSTSDTLTKQSAWQIYEHNGKYIASVKVDGEVVFLNPSANIVEEPYLFDTREAAREAILKYYNQYANESPSGSSLTPVTRSELRTTLTNIDSDGDLTDHDATSNPTESTNDNLSTSGENTSSSGQSNIQGQVTNSNGEPVEGATVHLYSDPRTATTGSDGKYSFENVPAGTHHLHVNPPEDSDLVATQNATLEMTDNGSISVVDSSDNFKYFSSNGQVTNNAINMQAPQGQPIAASGQGSRVAVPITFGNSKNADSVKVTLEGTYTEGTTRKQYQGDIYSASPGIDGNTKPKSQQLTIQGVAATERVSKTDSADSSGIQIPVTGNSDPRDVTVELKENYTETVKTSSGQLNGTSVPLNNSGNLSPDNVNLTLKTTQKAYDKHTEEVDLSNDDPNKTTVYQASETETVQIRSEYSYNYDNYDGYSTESGHEHHHYDFEDEVRVYIDRASEANETIYRYHAEKDPDSVDAPYKNYKGWYYGIDESGWSNSTADLQPGDKVIIEANRETTDDWIIADNVRLKSRVSQLKSPQSVSVTGAGSGVNTEKVGSGDSVTVTSSDIRTEAGMDEIQVSADNLNIEYQLNYTQRSGTAGAAVGANGNDYCRVSGGLTQDVTCDIPSDGLKGGQIDIGSDQGKVPYTVSYTKRVLPEQATVEINGEQYQYPQDFNGQGPLNTGTTTTIDSLKSGENDIEVSTSKADGAQPELKTIIRHSSDPKQTKNPRIYVISAAGDVNSKELPSSALVNGQLVENETVSLPAEWFSSGKNVIVVKTADSSQVKVSVQGQGLKTQTKQFAPAGEVPLPPQVPSNPFENDND